MTWCLLFQGTKASGVASHCPCQNDVKDDPLPYSLEVTTQKVSLPLVASALDSSHALEPDTEGKVGEVVDLDFSDLRLGR